MSINNYKKNIMHFSRDFSTKIKNLARLSCAKEPCASFLFQDLCSPVLPLCKTLGKIFSKHFFLSAGFPWENETCEFNISVKISRKIEKISGYM